jgi:hypothetical protein
MDVTEILIHEIERQRVFVILNLFGEAVSSD